MNQSQNAILGIGGFDILYGNSITQVLSNKALPLHILLHRIHPHFSQLFPSPYQNKTTEVNVTAFVSALPVSGEHKLRLLTSIFFTQVLHLIIE